LPGINNTINNLICYKTTKNFIYMTSRKIITENIKKISNKFGLAQDHLAKKAGTKYTTPMKTDGGIVNKSSVQTTGKIAKAFGVSIE